MPEDTIKAVLVRLSVPIMPNTREDKDLTEDFRKHKHLGIKAGKWSKHLLPGHAFEKMRKIGSDFRNQQHYPLTLPWEDGKQLLPAGAHEQYKQAAEFAGASFDLAREEFGKRYSDPYRVPKESRDAREYFDLLLSLDLPLPKTRTATIEVPCYVAQAKIMHNGTFNPTLYPSWKAIAKRFGFSVEYSPIPKASHFITSGIAAEAVEGMREELEERNAERLTLAVKDTWDRLIGPVQAIAEKLSSKDTIFRDSLISNVKDIIALIPALNLTGDSQLAAAAKAIELQFSNLDPELLRNDASVRKEVSSTARQLLTTFGKIGKRKFAQS